MSDEPFALSTVPLAPPAPGDYDAICATVMESSRGRWFLDEFARRNRNADTSLVLNAIERIERVIRGDRDQQAYQGFRMELLEMAKTIAVTRAEVAEIGPEPERAQAAAAAGPASDAFAAAERIQEVAWTMRERGLEPSTCDQIEALASSILSASALRDPNDRRAHKLAEVLQYLEHRINAMLDSCAESAPAAMAAVEAQSETGPSASQAEPHSAASALPAHHIEAESLPLAEPEQTSAAPAPKAVDDSADVGVEAAPASAETAEFVPAPEPPQAPTEPLSLALPCAAADEDPAPEFAIALATELVDPVAVTRPAAEPEPQPAPQSASAEPRIEVAELELPPLVVVRAGQSTAAEEELEAARAAEVAQPAELELAPLIPAAIEQPPLDHDTPAETGLEPMVAEPLAAPAATAEPTEVTAPTAGELQPVAAETAGDAFPSLSETAEAKPALPTIAPVDTFEYAGEALAADHPEPIALDLERLAVSAAFTDERPSVLDMALVASPQSATESAPPVTGTSEQPETLAIAAAAPAAPLAEREPALLQEEPAPPREKPAPSPAALVPDLPELAVEQPAVLAVQEEPGVAPPAPLAPEPAAEPSHGTIEPDAVMSAGPSAPMTEELAVMPASEVAAELPSETPTATDERDRSVPLAVEAPRETDMLSAAMPPSLPEPLPDEAAAAELADFLLEPLPLPATAGTATAGETDRETAEEAAREPSDVMSEIEEELFAVLPIEDTVPGLSPQSPDVAQPALAQAAAIPPSTAPAAPPAMAEVAQAADGAPQAATPIGTTAAAPARIAAKPMPRPAPNDPLAALKAMSDEERIALFT